MEEFMTHNELTEVNGSFNEHKLYIDIHLPLHEIFIRCCHHVNNNITACNMSMIKSKQPVSGQWLACRILFGLGLTVPPHCDGGKRMCGIKRTNRQTKISITKVMMIGNKYCLSPDFKKSNRSNKKIWRGSIIR